jgi:hypothetical protein
MLNERERCERLIDTTLLMEDDETRAEGRELLSQLRVAQSKLIATLLQSGLNCQRVAEIVRAVAPTPDVGRVRGMQRALGIVGRLRFLLPLRRRAKGGRRD